MSQVTLLDFTRDYCARRDVSADYRGLLLRRVRALQDFTGRKLLTENFHEQTLNEFLETITDRAPATRKGYRNGLLAIWRGAADDGLIREPISRRVNRIQQRPSPIECYTVEEVEKLLAATQRIHEGCRRGAMYRHGPEYWWAMIAVAWDSGARRGDLWRLDRDAIRPGGIWHFIQHKTGKPKVSHLGEVALLALQAIGESRYPLKWKADTTRFTSAFAKLRKLSGVLRGSFKWIRRASGSYVEEREPGMGHKFLGNSEVVFRESYDAQLWAKNLPRPPELKIR